MIGACFPGCRRRGLRETEGFFCFCRNVSATTYRGCVAKLPASPFPVDPADVPEAAVRYVTRTMLRHWDCEPLDDHVARLIVAGVIAVLMEDQGTVEAAAVLVPGYTLATGDVVAIQAAPEASVPA
jgi:hypothetical protein